MIMQKTIDRISNLLANLADMSEMNARMHACIHNELEELRQYAAGQQDLPLSGTAPAPQPCDGCAAERDALLERVASLETQNESLRANIETHEEVNSAHIDTERELREEADQLRGAAHEALTALMSSKDPAAGKASSILTRALYQGTAAPTE
jgi:ABC-type phosphate transport system auxiliary subunit